jgi:hypothetical protein
MATLLENRKRTGPSESRHGTKKSIQSHRLSIQRSNERPNWKPTRPANRSLLRADTVLLADMPRLRYCASMSAQCVSRCFIRADLPMTMGPGGVPITPCCGPPGTVLGSCAPADGGRGTAPGTAGGAIGSRHSCREALSLSALSLNTCTALMRATAPHFQARASPATFWLARKKPTHKFPLQKRRGSPQMVGESTRLQKRAEQRSPDSLIAQAVLDMLQRASFHQIILVIRACRLLSLCRRTLHFRLFAKKSSGEKRNTHTSCRCPLGPLTHSSHSAVSRYIVEACLASKGSIAAAASRNLSAASRYIWVATLQSACACSTSLK